MRNIRIFYKLFFTHATLVLFAVVILSLIFYSILRGALIQRTVDQLSSINILKKELIETHLSRSVANLYALQRENRLSPLFDHRTNASQPGSALSAAGEQVVVDLIRAYGFKNVHVFTNQSKWVYSVFPENASRSFDSLLTMVDNRADTITVVDASVYSPDQRTWLFYYLPVQVADVMVGFVLVEEDFEQIQEILLERTGMGATGESYIVGGDLLMRSASRFFPNRPPLSIWVETDAARDVFSDAPEGKTVLLDYRGVKVLSVYRPIDAAGIRWAILTEMDFQEAMEPIIRLGNYLFGSTLILVLVTAVITIFISNAIANPLLRLKTRITSLSMGVIPKPVSEPASTDEVAQINDALNQLIDGIRRTTTFARDIGSGNFDSSYTTLGPEDSLGQALLKMRDELRSIQERELKLLRGRAAALLEGQEDERKRITQELHDGVGQMLTAIRMRVDRMEGEQPLKNEVKSLVDETIAEVRRISYHVMPQTLVDYGLEAALKGLCENVRKFSGLQIDYRYVKEVEHALGFDVTVAVFRIVQEGLNNIVKHAHASQANLHILDKEDEIYLILSDNGQGLPAKDAALSPGSGLRNMRERAQLLGGTFEIHASSGHGTVIEVTIPVT